MRGIHDASRAYLSGIVDFRVLNQFQSVCVVEEHDFEINKLTAGNIPDQGTLGIIKPQFTNELNGFKGVAFDGLHWCQQQVMFSGAVWLFGLC